MSVLVGNLNLNSIIKESESALLLKHKTYVLIMQKNKEESRICSK